VTIDWVTVGDPGNAPDTPEKCAGPNCGSVAEVYRISKYEITNAQYAEFLNGVANEVDPFGLYVSSMAGIDFPPVPIGFERFYEVRPGFANKPVNQVTYYDALRFVNWMHNGQGPADTETGAYTLVGGTETPSSVLFNAGASIFLPSDSEWYKAAYYDPATAGYFDHPARSNSAPTCSAPTVAPNRATCGGNNGNLTDVGAFPGSPSPAGTFDQGGNVAEWVERGVGGDSSRAGVRGGSGGDSPSVLAASSWLSVLLIDHDQYLGFRVASPVPEPGLGPLGMSALLGLAGVRRRRSREYCGVRPGTPSRCARALG
jgi:MYXO-CTERM domain-containing protein